MSETTYAPAMSRTDVDSAVRAYAVGIGLVSASSLPDFSQFATKAGDIANVLLVADSKADAIARLTSYSDTAHMTAAISSALAPFETKADFQAATSTLQSAAQVAALILANNAAYETSAQVQSDIKAAIPTPRETVNVAAAVLTATANTLYGFQSDRAYRLLGYSSSLTSLAGVSAALSIQLTKNGTAIANSASSYTTTNLKGGATFATPIALAAGDAVEIVRTGLSVNLTPGSMYGYLMLAYA